VLVNCALLLRDTYAKVLPHALATQPVIATFATLTDLERTAILQALLRRIGTIAVVRLRRATGGSPMHDFPGAANR
jgi:hypothetical protein